MTRRRSPTVRVVPVRPTVHALPPLTGTALPSAEKEALGLLHDIDPHDPAQVEATRRLIDVTPEQEATLMRLTARDVACRYLVTTMLRFRVRVRARFDALVEVARRDL